MVAQPRFTPQATDKVRTGSAPIHLTPADARHEGFASPAVALQARLDAAISGGAWAGKDTNPHVDRWPGAVRVAVMLGGAGAS